MEMDGTFAGDASFSGLLTDFSGLLTDNAKRFGINGSSWPTASYTKQVLGPFGMVWDAFASAMFPYCSRDSADILDAT
jgi:hypothetical protein